MYDAMDIAEYVLDYCMNTLNHPIDNLYLQKFLYYIQGEYLKIYKEPIFDNDIVISSYGVFIPDVYYSYNNYGTCDITDVKQTIIISNEAKEIINKVVKLLINISIWEIIKRIKQESPYLNNYIKDCNGSDDIVIPIEDMKEYFCDK